MKTNKMISKLFTILLVLVFEMVTTQTFGQEKKAAAPEKMKNCKMDKKECKMDKKECSKDKKAKTTTAIKTTYVCPMHGDVKSNKPGVCPKCKMDLEKK